MEERVMNERVMNERMMMNNNDEIDLVELFHVLMRRLWVIVICLLAGAIVAGSATKLLITPMYEARSMIYILGKDMSVSGVNLQLSKQLTVDFEILAKSRPVLNEVINELGLDYSAAELEQMITVENPSESSILRMIVTSPNPEEAASISNAMADAVADAVSNVMATDKPSTVERAVVPKKPASPNILKNTALGGLLGAFAAAGVIVLLHLLDDTVKTEEDVRKYLQLNVLASVPKEKKGRRVA